MARQADETTKLLQSIQEVNDLEEGRPNISDDATETFIGKEKDTTIVIKEEDYGDETSALLENDDQIDSRPLQRDQSTLLWG